MLQELNADNVVDYARSQGWIGPEPARAEWLSGGVSNCVLRIEQGEFRLIVKQSRPQLRTRAAWFSDVSRIYREEDVQRLLSDQLPGRVPRVLGADRANYAYAMEHAPPGSRTWKERLLAGEWNPDTAYAAGRLLSDLHSLPITDVRLTDGTVFHQLRIEPFYERILAVHPDLEPSISPLIASMKRPQGLCHGDYSPKNLLVVDPSLMLVDHETAYLGDPGMDVGFFFSHLLLKAIHLGEPVLPVIRGALEGYGTRSAQGTGLGHLGVCLLARIDGTSPVDYLTSNERRATARRLGRKILLEHPSDWQTVLDWTTQAIRGWGT